jgi:ribosomal protein L37AE/L43A
VIRDKTDGKNVPMKVVDGKPVVDNEQLRLEHNRCPWCPLKLTWSRRRGWWYCRCCEHAWRKRPDGYFDEQLPLYETSCNHRVDQVAGSPQGILELD